MKGFKGRGQNRTYFTPRSGSMRRKDLRKNKNGRIVSVRKSDRAKQIYNSVKGVIRPPIDSYWLASGSGSSASYEGGSTNGSAYDSDDEEPNSNPVILPLENNYFHTPVIYDNLPQLHNTSNNGRGKSKGNKKGTKNKFPTRKSKRKKTPKKNFDIEGY